MEVKEVVRKTLEASGCQSSKSISAMAMRKFGVEVTPAQVSGVLRAMMARGDAACSSDGSNQRVYWLVKHEWEEK